MTPDFECTYWPEGWWHLCCVAHDIGGSDYNLFQCVVKTAPFPIVGLIIGLVMYAGVKFLKPFYLYYIRGKDVK